MDAEKIERTAEERAELKERLRMHRIILKSGDYDGGQLMSAWCDMINAIKVIEELEAELARRPSRTYADGVEDAARWIQDNWPHDKRTLVPAIRALVEGEK